MNLGRMAAVAGVVALGATKPVRSAGAQETDPLAAVPGAGLYGGVLGQGLLSHCAGGAMSFAVEIETGQPVFGGELTVGRMCNGWNPFAWALHAGAVLTPGLHAPYVLAGIQQSAIVVGARDLARGREDFALTGEAGYAYRRPRRSWQLWPGLRGVLPVTSHVYATDAPDLPSAVLILRLLIR